MRVISNTPLKDFAHTHPAADDPLQAWRKLVAAGNFPKFADLKKTFNSVDRVGDYYVFNISGNKYRIIAAIHFDGQRLYIRYVFTHKEYDRWTAENKK